MRGMRNSRAMLHLGCEHDSHHFHNSYLSPSRGRWVGTWILSVRACSYRMDATSAGARMVHFSTELMCRRAWRTDIAAALSCISSRVVGEGVVNGKRRVCCTRMIARMAPISESMLSESRPTNNQGKRVKCTHLYGHVSKAAYHNIRDSNKKYT